MAGEFRVGTLVAGIRVELESSAGVQQAQAQLRQLQSGAKQAGTQAGTAAGRGLSDGVVKGARGAGQQAGKVLGDAAVPDARRAGERAGAEFGKAAGGGIKKAAVGVASAVAGMFAVEQAASWLRGAKDAASDLNETTSKTAVIFGSSVKAMEQWGDSAARSVGLSKQAALESAASFGDMFLQLGVGQSEAVKMSKAVVGLAADFGSLSNKDTADVLERIAGGFRGEYDAIQALVPNLSAARVEKEALAMTGAKNADALTAQQKATAYLAILQKDGARAMGDFARTADGAANSEKIATALLQDQAAAIGQKLLPAWSAFLGFLNNSAIPALSGVADGLGAFFSVIGPGVSTIGDLARAFGQLPAPIQATMVAVAAARVAGGHMDFLTTRLTAARAGATSFSKDFGQALAFAGQASQRAGGGFAGAAAGLRTFTGTAGVGSAAMGALKASAGGLVSLLGGPWGIALGAAAAAVGWLVSKHQEAAEATRKHEEFVKSLAGTLSESTGAVTKQTLEMHAQQAVSSGLAKSMLEIGVSSETLGQALGGNADSYTLIRDRIDEVIKRREALAAAAATDAGIPDADVDGLKRLREQLDQQRGATGAAKEEWQRGKDVLDGLTKASDKATTATKSKADADRAAKEAADAHRKAMKEQADAIDAYASKQAGARQAQASYRAALAEAVKEQANLSGAMLKGGGDFDLSTEKGRKAQEMYIGIATAAREAAKGSLDQGHSTKYASDQISAARAQLVKHLTDLGMNSAAARKFADDMKVSRQTVDVYSQSVGKIPAAKATKVTTPNIEVATTKVAKFIAKTLKIPPSKAIQITADVSQALTAIGRLADVMQSLPSLSGFGTLAELGVKVASSTGARRRAGGGAVFGPGTGTSDSVVMPGPGGLWGLSNGEHVLTAAEVAKLGGHADVELLRALVRSGLVDQYTVKGLAQMRRRAAGGRVGGPFSGVDTSGLLGNLVAQLMGFDPAPKNEAAQKVEDGFDRLAETLKRLAGEQDAAADKVKSAAEALADAMSGGADATSQAASATGRMVGALAQAPEAYRRLFLAAEAKYGVSANLLAAQAKAESGFNAKAVSPAGARGLMQFMPGTARGLGVNPMDPASAIDGAARLMAQHLAKFGTTQKALAAYNAGPGNVGRWQNIAETRGYVAKIMADPGVKGVIVGAATTAATKIKPASQPLKDRNAQFIDVLKALRAAGLRIRENEALGDKVDPVHVNGSWHYKSGAYGKSMAADITGTQAQMNAAAKILNDAGFRTLWKTNVGGNHFNHVHSDISTGASIGAKGGGSLRGYVNPTGVGGGAGTPSASNAASVAKAQADLATSQAELAAAKKRAQVVEELLRTAAPVRKRLAELAVEESRIKADMEKAAKDYEDAVKRQQDYANQIASQNVAGGVIDSIFGAEGMSPSIDWIERALDDSTKKTEAFNAQLERLRSLGLSDGLLELIQGKGADVGSRMAQVLSEQGERGVLLVNAAYARAVDAQRQLGDDSARRLYDGAVNAAKGFADKLEADHNRIVTQMQSAAAAFIVPMLDLLRTFGANIPAEVTKQYAPILAAAKGAAPAVGGKAGALDAKLNLTQRIETVTPRDVRLYDANGSLIGLMQQIANTAVERKFQEVATVRQWGS